MLFWGTLFAILVKTPSSDWNGNLSEWDTFRKLFYFRCICLGVIVVIQSYQLALCRSMSEVFVLDMAIGDQFKVKAVEYLKKVDGKSGIRDNIYKTTYLTDEEG